MCTINLFCDHIIDYVSLTFTQDKHKKWFCETKILNEGEVGHNLRWLWMWVSWYNYSDIDHVITHVP